MRLSLRFIEKLDAVRESDGSTLLDNSMTLLGSGFSNASSHSNKNLPLLLAGGGFKHGQHLRFKKDKSAMALWRQIYTLLCCSSLVPR